MSTIQAPPRKLEPHRDPKSDRYVPLDADNRRGADPAAARFPDPPYTIDLGALYLASVTGGRPWFDVAAVVAALVDKLRQPRFHLHAVCGTCERLAPKLPLREFVPFAIDNAYSCYGCAYSLVDGVDEGDNFIGDVSRDAAFSAWAGARRALAELELKRRECKGAVEKERLAQRIDKAHARLRRASKRCHRLGFSPAMPLREDSALWQRPLQQQTRDARRRAAEKVKDKSEAAQSPSCRNCRFWDQDRRLSVAEGKQMGRCAARDGEATAGSYWCRDHALQEETVHEMLLL